MRVIRTWDSLNPIVQVDGEFVSTRVLERKYRDTLMVAQSLLEYVDAIPDDVAATLPAMPGIDRDFVDRILKNRA